MKIEKLTENKIRIIMNPSDFNNKEINLHLFMAKALEGHSFFVKLLEKAKKEVGFNTDGCKLLIEAFSSHDDVIIFTITKYEVSEKIRTNSNKKSLTVKRKEPDFTSKHAIYKFKSFENFCYFCEYIYHHGNFDIKKFSKNISLYLYQNTYYLVIKNINLDYKNTKFFYSIASEFSSSLRFSEEFESKLLEHGKTIIRRNAICTAIKYFVNE